MRNLQKFISFLVCLLLITISSQSGFCLPPGVWHVVRKGDTVWELSQKYKTRTNLILQLNKLNSPKRLIVGQKIFIPGAKTNSGRMRGTWHRVKAGDSIWELARKYHISSADIIRFNPIKSPRELRIGQTLFIPERGLGTTCLPLSRPIYITSGYGYRKHPISRRWCFHHGIDLRARVGTRVHSIESGRVIFVGRKSGYGKMVIVKHSNGFSSRYAHLYKIYVNHGQRVSMGTVVGLSGNTGYSTGPHLHFEVRYNGKSIDPAPYVK